jgi:endonuclease YncB( thermonuclease family)
MNERLMVVLRGLIVLLLATSLWAPTVVQAATAEEPPPDGEVARVVDVTDGDTIKVEMADGTIERLRYIGIDTPETVHPDELVQPWGPEASAANERLVADRVVVLERDVSDRDRFDRLLRYVWVETASGWIMVNDELVALGLAGVKAYEPDTRYHETFLQTEQQARQAGVGMHGQSDRYDGPMEPAALSLQFIEAYNRRDIAAMEQMISPAVVYVRPGGAKIEAVDAILALYEEQWARSDAFLRPRRFVRQDDTVIAELTIGPARRSQGRSVDAVEIHRWEGDQLVEYRLYLDPAPDDS